MEIRDTRNGDWYWVNTAINACKHITHAEKCVYGALATFGGCKEIHPNFETIAERSNVSVRGAKNAIKRLIFVGYIKVEKGGGRGKANVYNLLKTPKGCRFCTVSKGCKLEQERVQIEAIKGAKFAPQLDKEIDKENITGLDKPTSRKELKFNGDDYKQVIDAYKKFRGIEPQGNEYLPIQQSVKTMFMSRRKPEEIIFFMEWLAEKAISDDKKWIWVKNWTIKTIQLKLPEFLAGNFNE